MRLLKERLLQQNNTISAKMDTYQQCLENGNTFEIDTARDNLYKSLCNIASIANYSIVETKYKKSGQELLDNILAVINKFETTDTLDIDTCNQIVSDADILYKQIQPYLAKKAYAKNYAQSCTLSDVGLCPTNVNSNYGRLKQHIHMSNMLMFNTKLYAYEPINMDTFQLAVAEQKLNNSNNMTKTLVLNKSHKFLSEMGYYKTSVEIKDFLKALPKLNDTNVNQWLDRIIAIMENERNKIEGNHQYNELPVPHRPKINKKTISIDMDL